MVTYDPKLSIFYRTKQPHQVHYHVQYFGISAIRGWVFSKAIEPVNDPSEKLFPQKGFSQKLRSEYQVAIKELQEAYTLDYKERKLRFIFSFDTPSRSKRPRKESLSSQSRSSSSAESEGPSKQAQSVKVTSKPSRTSAKNEKLKPNVASRTTVITSTVTKQPSTTTDRGQPSLESGDSSVSQRCSETSHDQQPSTSLRRKRSTSGEHSGQQQTAHSTRHQFPKKRKDRCMQEKPGNCWCSECVESIPQDVKKLRCSSPPVEARELNLDSELNDSVVSLEVCEQQQQQQQLPQPTFFFQPAFTPLGGLPYPTTNCMYMSLQYASLWPSPAGMPATPPTLGQTPQVFAGLNMFCFDPQRQLLGDGLHNSRVLPFPTPALPSLPSSSFSAPRLLPPPPPTAASSSSSTTTTTEPSAPDPSLPSEVTQSQSMSTPPAVTNDTSPITSSKRPRRSNVRYRSGVVPRQPPEANTPTSSESELAEHPILRYHDKMPALSSSTEPGPERKAMVASGNVVGGGSIHNITSALLTPPTSSSEDSPSVDLEFERPITSCMTATSSELATASSSEETDVSSKPEAGRKRKRENKNMENEESSYKSGVCCICDQEDKDLLVCGGHCFGMFHLDCLGLMQPPNFKFVCDECLVSSSKCFSCGKSNGEVVKCNKPRCPKLYHLSCIEGNRLFSFDGRKSSSFTCPLHSCARCESIGGTTHVSHSNLLQCTLCPLALHKPDCFIAGCEIVNQTHMICYQHIKITKNVQLYSHLNLNTCLDCGKTGSLFCCDVCSAAYHMECLDEGDRPTNDSESWKCPSCTVHDLPVYGSLVLCKFGVWRYVCALCVCVCECVCVCV